LLLIPVRLELVPEPVDKLGRASDEAETALGRSVTSVIAGEIRLIDTHRSAAMVALRPLDFMTSGQMPKQRPAITGQSSLSVMVVSPFSFKELLPYIRE